MTMQRVFHRRNDEQALSAGFTLVELCVVIAMTAILTALLLPALSSAKEKSRRVVCKSNLRQLYLVCRYYSDDDSDILPSAGDNVGNYHSIRLSDQTYSNLVENYAGGASNIFYCPNLAFSTGATAMEGHDAYGYKIGYSYLADDVQTTVKGSDYQLVPVKFSDDPTNELLADANYWTRSQTAYSPIVKIAPHTGSGASVTQTPGSTVTSAATGANSATNSASLGAMGGNIELYDGSVTWRSINLMQTHSASSLSEAYGNW